MGTYGSVQPSEIITSHKRFAEGRRAKAQCSVCGDVILYRDLQRDWRGVYVCPDCLDPRHPQEHILVYADPEALEHPRPLLDRESGGTTVSLNGVIVRATFKPVGTVTATGT